jgi:hypothetical protein
MKIMYGDFVTGASGSQGGTTYSRNRYGAYKRQRTIPVNPDTPAQQAQKSILAAFAQGWRGLTQQQRDAWDAAVTNFIGTDVFANSKRLTGSALYTRLNSIIASIGGVAISVPPLPSAIPAAAIGAIVLNVTAPAYTVALTPPGAAFTVQIWATPPVSPGISYVKNLYKQIGAFVGSTVSPYDFEADYNAIYGIPPLGTKVFIKLVVVRTLTGLTSVANSDYTIVV